MPFPGPVREDPVTLRTEDGVDLVGLAAHGEDPSRGTVVVCHPHPLQGGTMNSKVVEVATRTASDLGFSTIRFNFRGVGGSSGRYGGSFTEVADVQAALSHVALEGPCSLVGYSFGSVVSARAAGSGAPIERLVLIGPPLTSWNVVSPPVPAKGVWIVLGDNDAFCRVEDAREFISAYREPRCQLRVVSGADHSFGGRLPEMFEALREALSA